MYDSDSDQWIRVIESKPKDLFMQEKHAHQLILRQQNYESHFMGLGDPSMDQSG